MTTEPQPLLRKGHVFRDPESAQGYRITRNVMPGEKVKADQMEAFGGAPEPQDGTRMPQWLLHAIDSLRARWQQGEAGAGMLASAYDAYAATTKAGQASQARSPA